MKPLSPLKFVPYETSHLEKVANVIDNMLMAREAIDALRGSHNYRFPVTKQQYEALTRFHTTKPFTMTTTVTVIVCDLCEGEGRSDKYYPWDQLDELERVGWKFVFDDGRIEQSLCPHCVAISPVNKITFIL